MKRAKVIGMFCMFALASCVSSKAKQTATTPSEVQLSKEVDAAQQAVEVGEEDAAQADACSEEGYPPDGWDD